MAVNPPIDWATIIKNAVRKAAETRYGFPPMEERPEPKEWR